MRRHDLTAIAVAAAVLTLAATYARAQEFTAHLTGFQELGAAPTATTFPTGAILSDGTGTAKLDLDRKAGTITYTLTYSNVGATPPLTGTVTQAHIHFGKSHVEGGILVFFCSNLSNGPPGTPTCPMNSGTITGTWTKASVVAIPGQNVNAGDFDALTDALFSNTAYANIHQTALPAGEIRGQVRRAEEEEQHRQQR
jgi:CHRD domain-containing protein